MACTCGSINVILPLPLLKPSVYACVCFAANFSSDYIDMDTFIASYQSWWQYNLAMQVWNHYRCGGGVGAMQV